MKIQVFESGRSLVLNLEQAGAGQGGAARAASLRVRTWPEYPERYLSEIIWFS